MHTPTPFEWQQLADAAQHLVVLLNDTAYPLDVDDLALEIRQGALDAARGLQDIADQERGLTPAAIAELRAEKRDDRRREEAAEMAELIGGASA